MGINGLICFVGIPLSRCNLVRDTHLEVLHMQHDIHGGMVLS